MNEEKIVQKQGASADISNFPKMPCYIIIKSKHFGNWRKLYQIVVFRCRNVSNVVLA